MKRLRPGFNHYDNLINAEIISTLLKLETEFENFEWDLSYNMNYLDLLTTALLQPYDVI